MLSSLIKIWFSNKFLVHCNMKTTITKELIEELLGQGLSTNQIGKQLGYSGAGIRWHMKKWSLTSNYQSIQDRSCYRTDTHKQCPKCSEIKELKEFDKRPNGNVQLWLYQI